MCMCMCMCMCRSSELKELKELKEVVEAQGIQLASISGSPTKNEHFLWAHRTNLHLSLPVLIGTGLHIAHHNKFS